MTSPCRHLEYLDVSAGTEDRPQSGTETPAGNAVEEEVGRMIYVEYLHPPRKHSNVQSLFSLLYLFQDQLSHPIFHCTVWSVISAHNLSSLERYDGNVAGICM